MRKFIPVGLSTLSAATISFGIVAPAAHAAPVVPGLCLSLPGLQAIQNASLVGLNGTLNTANVTYATADAAFNAGITAWVSALVNHLNVADAGGNVVGSEAILDSAGTTLGVVGAAWANAKVAVASAQEAVNGAVIGQSILDQFFSGLCT